MNKSGLIEAVAAKAQVSKVEANYPAQSTIQMEQKKD